MRGIRAERSEFHSELTSCKHILDTGREDSRHDSGHLSERGVPATPSLNISTKEELVMRRFVTLAVAVGSVLRPFLGGRAAAGGASRAARPDRCPVGCSRRNRSQPASRRGWPRPTAANSPLRSPTGRQCCWKPTTTFIPMPAATRRRSYATHRCQRLPRRGHHVPVLAEPGDPRASYISATGGLEDRGVVADLFGTAGSPLPISRRRSPTWSCLATVERSGPGPNPTGLYEFVLELRDASGTVVIARDNAMYNHIDASSRCRARSPRTRCGPTTTSIC